MKKGTDIAAEFNDLYLVHQNIPSKKHKDISHSAHILFLPLQGEIRVRALEQNFSVGPGHMLFLPSDTPHSFDSSDSAGERLIAMISSKSSLAKKLNEYGPVVLPLSQLIKEILFYLLLHPKTANSKSLVSVLIETLSESLTATNKTGFSKADHLDGKINDERLRKATALIKQKFSEKISLDKLAEQAGLSSRNFNRLLIQEIGMTPKQYLISVRIEKAQELLIQPNASVTDVAFEVGYNSLSQFIAAFRSQTGQLPSEVARFGRKPKIYGE